MQPPSRDSTAEVTVLKEELQLVLKKEREAQVSVHTPAPVNHVAAFLLTHFISVLRRRSWPPCVHLWPLKWKTGMFLTSR